MAVYTQLGAEALAEIIGAFDVGKLVSAKGIAEGVSNSNWLIDTDGSGAWGSRFILTMYEQRTNVEELPFFLGMLDHLAENRCPVPRTIHDRDGLSFRLHQGKALALIEFLPGVSVSAPTPAQARAVGSALAQVHLAGSDFSASRANGLALADWHALLDDCGAAGLASIDPALADLVARELATLELHWPHHLPRSVIHADLFPDNVLMLGDKVTGLIDFYFACNDITAYDIAVTHAAWCFSLDGRCFDASLSEALLGGYGSVRALADDERTNLPILARGAAMRFLSTRAYDWLHTPADAMVTRKDPMAFARRLEFYADPANSAIFAA
jgi:homoserine kinase type II